MTTVTGKIEDATGVTLHATIDFVSRSTPLCSAGVLTTNTDKTIRSNPSDGTFAVLLAAGNYQVTVAADGQSTSFNIAVPEGNGTASIETLVTTPLVYTSVAPTILWNGQRAGHITFIPTPPPPLPTLTVIPFAGGHVNSNGGEFFSYFISHVTATGQTNVSPQLAVVENVSPTADRANRIGLVPNPTGVTTVNIWRTLEDHGRSYDLATFPTGVRLLATLSATADHYDDWESTAEFAARADASIVAPLINTTAGELLSSANTVCGYITDQGLVVPSLLTVQASANFPGSNIRFTQGVGLEIFNFDTQLWHTFVCTGNPAQIGLTTGHS